jgi:xanthine dehydrogenase accessory factor
MAEILAYLRHLREREARVAVATLVSTAGTTPKKPGATMWVGESGRILGSVTIGGCVDARVIEESERAIATGTASCLEMSLGDEDAWDLGMTCGGSVRVLVEPVDLARPDDPVAGALAAADAEIAAGRRAVSLATLAGRPARIVVREDGSVAGTLGDARLDAAVAAEGARLLSSGAHLATMVTVTLDGRARDLFAELLAPPTTVLVFGATHVAIPLVTMARALGYRTVVVDPRERFATRERFVEADEIRIGPMGDIARSIGLTRQSCVVLVAHDYKFDLPVLRAALASEASYIGLLGSTRRGRAILGFLAEEGVTDEALARVRVPIGLDIGAATAAEIALSVMAEIVAVRTGRPGTPMRQRTAATAKGGG